MILYHYKLVRAFQ